METKKIKCTCSCHNSGVLSVMHMQACCNDGWIDVPVIKNYVRNGDYLRYYNNNDGNGVWTIQFHEDFDGKYEVDDNWEVLEETIGRVYVVKPEKIKDENETDSKN